MMDASLDLHEVDTYLYIFTPHEENILLITTVSTSFIVIVVLILFLLQNDLMGISSFRRYFNFF